MYAADEAWDKAVESWLGLVAEDHRLADIDYLVERYYRWTPPLADIMRQIATRANT